MRRTAYIIDMLNLSIRPTGHIVNKLNETPRPNCQLSLAANSMACWSYKSTTCNFVIWIFNTVNLQNSKMSSMLIVLLLNTGSKNVCNYLQVNSHTRNIKYWFRFIRLLNETIVTTFVPMSCNGILLCNMFLLFNNVALPWILLNAHSPEWIEGT